MGKHSPPGPPNQPARAAARVDADEPLAAYNKRRRPPMDIYRRRPPMDIYRRHRPVHGCVGHFRPDDPHVLEEWDDFT
ncbi:DUF6087 family protein [Streptomyces avermitilis]